MYVWKSLVSIKSWATYSTPTNNSYSYNPFFWVYTTPPHPHPLSSTQKLRPNFIYLLWFFLTKSLGSFDSSTVFWSWTTPFFSFELPSSSPNPFHSDSILFIHLCPNPISAFHLKSNNFFSHISHISPPGFYSYIFFIPVVYIVMMMMTLIIMPKIMMPMNVMICK